MKPDKKRMTYLKAQRHVEHIKDFYSHLVAYLLVNMIISSVKVFENISDGETFSQAFFDFGTFAVWIFWGIGLAIHAFSVFGFPFILGENWEENKIKQFMKEERENKWE